MLNGENREITGGYVASILHAVAQYGEVDGRIGGTLVRLTLSEGVFTAHS